jgi:hypothetical protein
VKLSLEAIAKLAHETNRAYCQSIGDDSQIDWNGAPLWQQASAIDGVKYLIKHPQARVDALHNNWKAIKEKEGWVYGKVKDPKKKEHPCMLRHEELPMDQQIKDQLFKSVVRSVMPLYDGSL